MPCPEPYPKGYNRPMKTVFKISKAKIADLCRRHHVRRFSLFGSVLRDDFGPQSDVDVLISFAPGISPTLADLAVMREELEALFNKNVDLVEEEAIRNPYRRAFIFNGRKILYAA